MPACKILITFAVDQVGVRLETNTLRSLSSDNTAFLQALIVRVKVITAGHAASSPEVSKMH